MIWLSYVFYGLMVVVGGASFVLYLRAGQARAWIWILLALIGVAGIVAVTSGHTEGRLRSYALAAALVLFAVDHFISYAQSKRAGSPRSIHAWLGIGWLALAGFQLVEWP